ncbi:hypothetical protein D881_03295 [Corynebacterium ulcerans NCTC 12077]|nr:hypothetical protein D881_03295 [Corynebacterium ulcerans NCTC 12077]
MSLHKPFIFNEKYAFFIKVKNELQNELQFCFNTNCRGGKCTISCTNGIKNMMSISNPYSIKQRPITKQLLLPWGRRGLLYKTLSYLLKLETRKRYT